MEEKIRFTSGENLLEGLLSLDGRANAVVVTHPHPLYGGDMYNPVVETAARAFREQGYAALRFNFRGVGRSGGRYDNGVGEQEDLRAAVAFMREQGVSSVEIAGYSFGAWVAALLAGADPSFHLTTMVAPPAAFVKFPDNLRLPQLNLVVTGSLDEFAPRDMIKPMMAEWNENARFEEIYEADHFYFGFLDELKEIVRASAGRRNHSR